MISRRRLLPAVPLALMLPAVVAACGWEPLYADPQTGAASEALRAVKVTPIPERIGQQLEMALRASFNPNDIPTKPIYRLDVTVRSTLQDLGIQSQGLSTRGEVQVTADYKLVDLATNKVQQSGSIHTNDSFDIQANGYSTVVAEDDAKRRCVEDLRREIVARLTLLLQNKEPIAS